MAKKTAPEKKKQYKAEKRERAMIEGLLEGSPDAIGVVVIRIECGCHKMAAVAKNGEPASKVVIYRDGATSICDKCKEDNGDYMRVREAFIDWVEPGPSLAEKQAIETKVLGAPQTH